MSQKSEDKTAVSRTPSEPTTPHKVKSHIGSKHDDKKTPVKMDLVAEPKPPPKVEPQVPEVGIGYHIQLIWNQHETLEEKSQRRRRELSRQLDETSPDSQQKPRKTRRF